MTDIIIRHGRREDEAAIGAIEYRTGYYGEDLTGRNYFDDKRLLCLLFACYYTRYELEHSFVAVDVVTGKVVGYIVGAEKGIVKYSASGVGEKIKWKNGFVYQYVLAFNSDFLDPSLQAELNIISLAATSVLRSRKIERKAKQLEMDIDKAREIQLNILPESAFTFYDYEIYGISQPDRIVGGDFFDYLYTDSEKDRLGIVIGDAASKGFRAASQALYVVGALRMGVSYHTKISSLISRINRIVNKAFAEEQFVSMFYAELTDNQKGLFLYSNAGHNSPFVYHASTNTHEVLEPTGQLLGPFPDENYRVENTYLQKGDVCLMYTDGVSEARGAEGKIFGEQRIVESLASLHKRSAKEICQSILNEVNQFSQDSEEYTDDKSIVVIKRN